MLKKSLTTMARVLLWLDELKNERGMFEVIFTILGYGMIVGLTYLLAYASIFIVKVRIFDIVGLTVFEYCLCIAFGGLLGTQLFKLTLTKE